MDRNKKSLTGSVMLVITALIWGFAFVAQSDGIEKVGAFTFNGVRYIIGSIVLLPVIFSLKRKFTTESIIGGLCCGICLFIASTFQNYGIAYTNSVGKAGFITALYVILVPVFRIFSKHMPSVKLWIGVALAAVGLYLLCVDGDFVYDRSDILLFACAVCFTFHILVIDYFSPRADGVVISCIQFFVAGVLSCFFMFTLEQPTIGTLVGAWLPILFAGVCSCGIAYTLQIVFQKDVDPTKASIILSLESVFAVLGGWMLLGQSLSVRELIGCVLMLVAIVLAQI